MVLEGEIKVSKLSSFLSHFKTLTNISFVFSLWIIESLRKKYERMARETTDVCLRVLKESNRSRVDCDCNDHVTGSPILPFRDCRMHCFPVDLSRNSCITNLFESLRRPGYNGQKEFFTAAIVKLNVWDQNPIWQTLSFSPWYFVTYQPGVHCISLSQEDRGVHGPYLGTGEPKAAEDLKPWRCFGRQPQLYYTV